MPSPQCTLVGFIVIRPFLVLSHLKMWQTGQVSTVWVPVDHSHFIFLGVFPSSTLALGFKSVVFRIIAAFQGTLLLLGQGLR